MATMEKSSRIVRCPKCLALLQEPPPGIPLYKCGNCSTVLRAKHAAPEGTGARRISERPQRFNRTTPPANADSVDGRKLSSKPSPPDHMTRHANVSDHNVTRSGTGVNRPASTDTGKKSPSRTHHSSYPPGLAPPTLRSNNTNTIDDVGRRLGDDHQKLVPPDPTASPRYREDDVRGRNSPASTPLTKGPNLAYGEDVPASNRPSGHSHYRHRSPPNEPLVNSPGVGGATCEIKEHAGSRSRNAPSNISINPRLESPRPNPVIEAAHSKPPPVNVANEVVDCVEKERQDKSDCDDDAPFSPTKALAAIYNAGPLYKVRSRQTPGQSSASNYSNLSAGRGSNNRGRNKSEGDDFLDNRSSDLIYEQKVKPSPSTAKTMEERPGLHRRQSSDGVTISALGKDLFIGHPGLKTVLRRGYEDVAASDKPSKEVPATHHLPQNDYRAFEGAEVITKNQRVRHHSPSCQVTEATHTHDQKSVAQAPASDVASQLNEKTKRQSCPTEQELPLSGPMSLIKCREDEDVSIKSVDSTTRNQRLRHHSSSGQVEEVTQTHDQKWAAQTSSSDVVSKLNETSNKPSTPPEQGISPPEDISFVKWRQDDVDIKEWNNEKAVILRDTVDDEEHERNAILEAQPPRTGLFLLSPPRNVAMYAPISSHKPVFGGVQPYPEYLSKTRAPSRQGSDTSSIPQDLYGLPDVLDYDTSDGSSNVDDVDAYPIESKSHSGELKLPSSSHGGRGTQAVEIGGNNAKSKRAGDQNLMESKSLDSENVGVNDSFGVTTSGASPKVTPLRSPESVHSASPFHAQTQENVAGQSESLNDFSYGGDKQNGSAYSSLKGQPLKVRVQINNPVPDRIYVRCRHCNLQLEVPQNLSPSESGAQRLRCGSCWKISRFRINHLLEPYRSSSPAASDNSPESSFRLSSNSSDGLSGRYSGTRSNRETGSQDRVIIRTQSGASLPVPPSGRHNPRAASGSKLANMVLGSSLLSETSKASTPNTSGDMGPAGSSSQGGKENIGMSPSGQVEVARTSLSPSTSLDAATGCQQKVSPDRKLLRSGSGSDEDKGLARLKLGPSAFTARTNAWSPDTPDFDDGQEFKGLKGFLKKSVFTKGKKTNQYRRKVIVNGHAVPDDVVKKAEEYAGFIHPGSYWYDIRAGFWGVMGGPCLGMIPPFIEELNYTMGRHCSQGKTGVLVNGRELHHKDLELLKKRGLPGTPGKSYNVDIDGRLIDAETGTELKGLGRLAPTLEQTGKGPGMWVPESQRGL